MKKTVFILLGFILASYRSQAQISSGTICVLDYSAIVCRYDDNGNRIFRGFALICDTDTSLTSPSSSKLTALTTAKAYPNPTTGSFTLQLENTPPTGSILYMVDAQGKILQELYANTAQLSLSLQPYSAGVYSVVIVQADKKIYWRGTIAKIVD